MSADLTGQILDGKYLIKKLLGEGGMGAVYLAEHVSMGKLVAVKLLHSMFVSNEEVVKRFSGRQELRLQSPTVIL
jgi:serine/threonine-protein kinase